MRFFRHFVFFFISICLCIFTFIFFNSARMTFALYSFISYRDFLFIPLILSESVARGQSVVMLFTKKLRPL